MAGLHANRRGKVLNHNETGGSLFKADLYRVAYEYAAQLGQSATEYEPDGKAAAEIRAMYASMCQLLDMSTQRRADQEKTYAKAT